MRPWESRLPSILQPSGACLQKTVFTAFVSLESRCKSPVVQLKLNILEPMLLHTGVTMNSFSDV